VDTRVGTVDTAVVDIRDDQIGRQLPWVWAATHVRALLPLAAAASIFVIAVRAAIS
jgi:hypothetical protein